jgi:hypothetical protein
MANKAKKYPKMARPFIASTYHSRIILKHAFDRVPFTGC